MECIRCLVDIDSSYRNANSKYCYECQVDVRAESQKKQKDKHKSKMKGSDIDYICRYIWRNYKYKAPKRGYEFCLSLEYFILNFRAPCFYCGENIKNVGFDRVDNNIGYIEENVVPCCDVCNRMKRTQTKSEFIRKCHLISNKH